MTISAYQQVQKLLEELINVTANPVTERISGQISVLCRAYMEPSEDFLPNLDENNFSRGQTAILQLLYARKGHPCSKTALLNVVPRPDPNVFPDTKTADAHISYLRKKLRGTSYEDAIETIRGRGYQMRSVP